MSQLSLLACDKALISKALAYIIPFRIDEVTDRRGTQSRGIGR